VGDIFCVRAAALGKQLRVVCDSDAALRQRIKPQQHRFNTC
jgi:hypothetical protein